MLRFRKLGATLSTLLQREDPLPQRTIPVLGAQARGRLFLRCPLDATSRGVKELQHRSVPSFGLFADASSNKRAQINIDIGDGVYVEKGLLKKLRLDPNNSGLQFAVSLVKALLTKDVEGRSFFGRPSNAFHRRIRWIPRSTPYSDFGKDD
ncbi:uncharacterized protein LOC142575553 isoform X3 [Dermacentor variabilis]|uniref:uncharacterized protein LOC142575553 isoform X3 n=1 Tax=Dermacentor variabilis TaxID=34621 RepID=UPI003F5B9523